MCTWCRNHVENVVHVLFECSFAKEVWTEVGLENVVAPKENDEVLDVLRRVFDNTNREQRVMVGLFCWSLWFHRNKWVWEKTNAGVCGVKIMGLNLLAEWRRARKADSLSPGCKQTYSRSWEKPSEGWVKVNIDAACRNGDDFVGVGCVMRNDRGEFMRARCNLVRGRWKAREAEAISLKEALSWTKEWGATRCIFESDAKLVVDAIYGLKGKSVFHTIIEDCCEIIKHFEEVLVVFVNRSANTVAHLLAQAAYSMSGLKEWNFSAPDFITCNLALDELN